VTTPGKNYEGQFGFPTPDSTPKDTACRVFRVPASDEWLGSLMGAVELLQEARNWYNWGSLTTDEAADAWQEIILQSYDDSLEQPNCAGSDSPAPYWDTAEDVDDSLPVSSETWYGEVADPDAGPEDLEFVENAAIWALTGFIAYSGQIGAAIFFHTIAPRFVLAFKAGDVGEVIRIVIDSADYGTVDTTDHAGEIIRKPILPETSETGHDIMLVKTA